MSSINGSVPFIPAYQPVEKGHIDNDKPKQNPLDKTAGEDAEVFTGKNTGISAGDESRAHAIRNQLAQTFLASDEKPVDNSLVPERQSAADLLPTDKKNIDNSLIPERPPAADLLPSDKKPIDNSLVSAKRDAIDFEIKSDGNGGWIKA